MQQPPLIIILVFLLTIVVVLSVPTKVVTWLDGSPSYQYLNQNVEMIQVTASETLHTAFLGDDGKVYTKGYGNSGQLGDGTTTARHSYAPIPSSYWGGRTIVHVLATYYRTHVIASDGTMFSWGHNDRGQLGDGTTTNRLTPVMANSTAWQGKTIKSIACGGSFCATLSTDRTVYTWGHYEYVGTTGSTNKLTPAAIDSSTWNGNSIEMISAGLHHTLALTTSGEVYGWGVAYVGVDGSGERVRIPVKLTQLTKPISMISVAYTNSYAVANDGTLYAWGHNWYYQVGDGTQTERDIPVVVNSINVTQVAAAMYRVVALGTDGKLYRWGCGSYPNCDYTINTPTAMQPGYYANEVLKIGGSDMLFSATVVPYCLGKSPSDPSVCFGAGNCTHFDRCECKPGFSVNSYCRNPYCFGIEANAYDTCSYSNGECVNVDTCACYEYFYGDRCQYQNSSRYISYPKSTSVSIWGSATYGHLGIEAYLTIASSATPRKIESMFWQTSSQVVQVGAGYVYAVALTSDGSVFTWGLNEYGNLGFGTDVSHSSFPRKIDSSHWNGRNITTIVAGAYTTGALSSTGDVFLWGDGGNGFGDGTYNAYYLPVMLDSSTWNGKAITSMALGMGNAYALSTDGAMFVWGSNEFGQLGDGLYDDWKATPVELPSSSFSGLPVTMVAAGGFSAIALVSNGSLFSWGQNEFGQLGLGDIDSRYLPTIIDDSNWKGKTITSIATGERHCLALTSDGTIFGWGMNTSGQVGVGDGNYFDQLVPFELPNSYWGGKTITKISAGLYFSLAMASDGTVFGWGANSEDQLGIDGGTTDTPTVVSSLAGRSILTVVAGSWVSMVIEGTTCHGILIGEPTVCSGHGACITTDNCQCNAGYIGSQCEIPVCFGVPANDTAVCSNGAGTCVSPDTCSCTNVIIPSEFGYSKVEVSGAACGNRSELRYYLSSVINGTVHLNESEYYVDSSLTVAPGGHLFVPPGATIFLKPSQVLLVEGTLIARGNSTSRITIDVNAAASPGERWGTIVIKATAQQAVLEYVNFKRGGQGAATSVVQVFSSVAIVDQVSFENCEGFAVYACGEVWAPGSLSGIHPYTMFMSTTTCL